MEPFNKASFDIEDESLYRLAFYDPLTGLPNRANLIEHFRHALMVSAREGTFGALMFCDLDKFKAVNDNHGHQVGDLLLRAAGQRLEQCVREVDLVARHGGDEFIVLVLPKDRSPAATGLHAEAVAAKIVASLGAPYTLGRFSHAGSVSVGIVLFNGAVDTVESSFRCADKAMYEAKMKGRNQFRFFDLAMQQAMVRRYELDRAMADAIKEQQFRLHYQPQVNLNGEVVGAECLLRWLLPNGAFAHPCDFLDAAEDSGLIVEIGKWVIQCACERLAFWQSRPETEHLTLSVNLSLRQFARADLSCRVAEILAETRAAPRGLTFELDESLFFSDPVFFTQQVRKLHDLGISFAFVIADAPPSLLRKLEGLPIKQLKISRALTSGVDVCDVDAILVRSIIAISKILGFLSIGEGIESGEQRKFLEGAGCAEFQGHLYMPAIPDEAFIDYALRNSVVHGGMHAA